MNLDSEFKIERRRFLKQSKQLISVLPPLLSIQGCNLESSTPAYAYWQQKEKGEFTDFQYIVMCGTLAANAHNTQPWLFKIEQQQIHLYADRERHLGAADADRRLMLMSIGCAIENMTIAARQLGYQVKNIMLDADARFKKDGYCAGLELTKATVQSDPLFDSLFLRQTTRSEFLIEPIPNQFMENIQSNIFQQLGLKWAGDIENRACTIGAVQAAVRDFLNHPQMNRDVMNWFRITRDEWNRKRDGISIFTSDAPEYIKLWVELFSFQEDLLSEEFVQAEIDFIDRVSQATLFWGLIYGNNNQKNTQIIAGRMIERVYLHAQANGLAVHPISYPTEMPKQKAHLKKVFNLKEQEEPLFLFRLGKGVYLERSVRRDLKTVLI